MPKRQRTNAVRIRVSTEERGAIERAAEAVGLGVCSFARMATMKAAGRKPAQPPRRRPDAHAVALAQWTAQLARLGVNLNQLARVANAGLQVDAAELEVLRTAIGDLRETVLKFHAEPLADDP